MRLSDSSWHEECLFCSQCHCPLVNSCYYRDGKLFCRVDYERSVGTGSTMRYINGEDIRDFLTRCANKMHSRRQIFEYLISSKVLI